MSDNPNTTEATAVYREGVHDLRIALDLVVLDLNRVEEAHAHVPVYLPTDVHAVAHFKLNLALDLLGDVVQCLMDEEQSGVAR